MLHTFTFNIGDTDEEEVFSSLAEEYKYSDTMKEEQEVTISAEESVSGQEEVVMKMIDIPNTVTLLEHMAIVLTKSAQDKVIKKRKKNLIKEYEASIDEETLRPQADLQIIANNV